MRYVKYKCEMRERERERFVPISPTQHKPIKQIHARLLHLEVEIIHTVRPSPPLSPHPLPPFPLSHQAFPHSSSFVLFVPLPLLHLSLPLLHSFLISSSSVSLPLMRSLPSCTPLFSFPFFSPSFLINGHVAPLFPSPHYLFSNQHSPPSFPFNPCHSLCFILIPFLHCLIITTTVSSFHFSPIIPSSSSFPSIHVLHFSQPSNHVSLFSFDMFTSHSLLHYAFPISFYSIFFFFSSSIS